MAVLMGTDRWHDEELLDAAKLSPLAGLAESLGYEMDEWLEEVEPLSSFILPSGNPVVGNLHLARAVTRRCERRLATLRDSEGDDSVRIVSLTYLNRLSDWLFVMCRVIAARLGEDEELWEPLGKRNQ